MKLKDLVRRERIKSGHQSELANLDFIRSVAVLLVIFTHVRTYTHRQIFPSQWVWFLGLIGVFIFFTHTALVLMWSLERDPAPLNFYLRRIFRLYPLWLVVLFLSLAIRLPTSPYFAPQFRFFRPGGWEVLQNALLVMNLFGAGVARVIGASWSLPVEAQMYVVLPFLFFVRSNHRLLPLLILDGLAIAMARRLDPKIAQDLLFCTPLFLPGAMAYVGFRKWRAVLPAWSFVVWIIVLVAGVDLYASRTQDSFRSGWIFCLALGMTLPLFQQLSFRPLVRTASLVARYSYGLYLCHFAAIAIGLHYMARFNLVLRALAFVASLTGLSVFFYHTVEKPMIRLGGRLAGSSFMNAGRHLTKRDLRLEPAP